MGLDVITIRPLSTTDAPVAADLEAANRPRPWTEAVVRDELAAPGRTYLAADSGGSFVGFGGVMVVGDEAHITNLLVEPSVRRQGIGRSLLSALIAAAVEAGARHLTLEVRSRNAAAIALYSSVGLAPVGARPGYYIDDDALIMWAHDIDRPAFGKASG